MFHHHNKIFMRIYRSENKLTNLMNRLSIAPQTVSREAMPAYRALHTPTPPPQVSDGLTSRRQWRAASLAWLLAAFALSCLAPANAIAQTSFPDTLNLVTDSGTMLSLLFRVTTAGGKTYYYWDEDNNGVQNGQDHTTHIVLDNLLNDGDDTDVTLEGVHDGSDDARSAFIGDYTLVLPTVKEMESLYSDQSNNLPAGWRNVTFYWTANRIIEDRHRGYRPEMSATNADDTSLFSVAFQVLLTPVNFGARTIADQNYVVNQTVSVELPEATGGTAPLNYTLTRPGGSPRLPTGLTFNATARPPTITGAPTVAFATVTPAALVYTVTDANNVTAQLNFTLQVLPQLTFRIKVFLEGAQ